MGMNTGKYMAAGIAAGVTGMSSGARGRAVAGMRGLSGGTRKYGMMAGGAMLVGGAASMAHRHRQASRSSGGDM